MTAPSFLKRELKLGRRTKAAGTNGGGFGRPKQLVGLKIGSSYVSAAVVANNGGPRLVKVAREQLPAGLVAGGEVREPEALATALDGFFRTHDLPRRNVRLGVGSNRIGVRIFERPGVDDPQQLANAIRFRAHEALPIPIEEAMLDYHLVDDADGPGRVLLAVTYRDLVNRFALTCAAAKVHLVGIDLEAFALLRALVRPSSDLSARRDAALVAVSVGHDRTTVAVSDGRLCEFVRVLEWGGDTLTTALAKALRVEPAEAEAVKRSLSLLPTTQAQSEEKTRTQPEDVVRRALQSLARELVSSLEFYQAQPTALAITEILLTGGTSQMPGLDDELQRLTGLRVRVADPFTRVRGAHEAFGDDAAGSLTVPIGLGIED